MVGLYHLFLCCRIEGAWVWVWVGMLRRSGNGFRVLMVLLLAHDLLQTVCIPVPLHTGRVRDGRPQQIAHKTGILSEPQKYMPTTSSKEQTVVQAATQTHASASACTRVHEHEPRLQPALGNGSLAALASARKKQPVCLRQKKLQSVQWWWCSWRWQRRRPELPPRRLRHCRP